MNTSDKTVFSVNKVTTGMLFFYNLLSLSAMGFLYYNFQLVFDKLQELEKANQALTLQNTELHRFLLQLQNANSEVSTALVTKDVLTPMSEDYKMFLIKLILIISILSLGGLSAWYAFYWFKFSFLGSLYKGFLTLGTIPSFFSTTGFTSLFYTDHIKSFSYTDRFENVITVKFTENSADIFVKLANTDVTSSLEAVFARHPEIFSNLAQVANSGVLALENAPSSALLDPVIISSVEQAPAAVDVFLKLF
jgi:hypothetical protein